MIIDQHRSAGSVDLMPTIADENDAFTDEGSATTGWTAGNATLSVTNGYLRETKVGAGSSSMSKALTFTPTDQDFILYGKMRASEGADHIAVVWLLDGAKEVSLWFGTANASTVYTAGAVSVCGTTGASTRNVAQALSGQSYGTTPVEFALQFDKKFSVLNCFILESGKWRLRARVACDWFSASTIDVLNTTASPTGAWCEFDHLMLAKPNVMSIGDSIDAGAILHNPDLALALSNNDSTWQHHAQLYSGLRNNLIVSKGVGSQTSTQIAARVVADVLDHDPRVVLLGASSNDEVLGVSKATRSTNIQNTINSITGAGVECVLLNGMYGTSAGADNQPTPDLRDYMLDWWTNYAPALTGAAVHIDIMQPMLSAGFQSDPLTQGDGIHPEIAGYQAIGEYIEAQP